MFGIALDNYGIGINNYAVTALLIIDGFVKSMIFITKFTKNTNEHKNIQNFQFRVLRGLLKVMPAGDFLRDRRT